MFGAAAQMRYTEPVATLDSDVLGGGKADRLDSLRDIYAFCADRGYLPEGEAVRVGAWPTQFVPVFTTLTREALDRPRLPTSMAFPSGRSATASRRHRPERRPHEGLHPYPFAAGIRQVTRQEIQELAGPPRHVRVVGEIRGGGSSMNKFCVSNDRRTGRTPTDALRGRRNPDGGRGSDSARKLRATSAEPSDKPKSTSEPEEHRRRRRCTCHADTKDSYFTFSSRSPRPALSPLVLAKRAACPGLSQQTSFAESITRNLTVGITY